MAKANENAVKRSTDPVKKADKTAKKGLGERISQWFRDLKSELKKVVWPTKKQVANNTLVAVVVIILAALILWGFDSLAQAGSKALLELAKV